MESLPTKLLDNVQHALKIDIAHVVAWTDSTVVLLG